MSTGLARRATLKVAFDGVDITENIAPYLLSATYTDSEEDEADDLQIVLQDRDGLWANEWLGRAVDAAAGDILRIKASISRQNWDKSGQIDTLDCGQFALDTIKASGPPSTITLKASGLPYRAKIRAEQHSKAWENCTLQMIAGEMAASAGMALLYDAPRNPSYARTEQDKQTDIIFLQKLCQDAGLSLKVNYNQIIIFDQAKYEAQAPIRIIKRGDGSYTKFDLSTSSAKTAYDSCRVRHTTSDGKAIEGIAKKEGYREDNKSNRQLEIIARVDSIAEAQALAAKRLRLHNKYARSAQFTLPGNPWLRAGLAVQLADWGAWDGKYLIAQARHSIGASGYTTQIQLRKTMEGL